MINLKHKNDLIFFRLQHLYHSSKHEYAQLLHSILELSQTAGVLDKWLHLLCKLKTSHIKLRQRTTADSHKTCLKRAKKVEIFTPYYFFNFIKSFQTAGVRSRIVDRGFLQMGVGLSLKDRVRSSGLRVELLLHCIKRSQLTRMSTRNWDILSMSYQEDSPRPGNASVFPLGELKEVARGTQRRFGLLCQSCCHNASALDEQMDGWKKFLTCFE